MRHLTMNMICSRILLQDPAFEARHSRTKQGVIFIVCDDAARALAIAPICDFLDLDVRMITSDMDLLTMLRAQRPLALIADIDGSEQDGFHTMKVVAAYNRNHPVLLLTNGDPQMIGAAEAVAEMFGLRSVASTEAAPAAGQVIEFLFNAGRTTGCMRLVPV
jgi:PleD family two-component response regulator